jgi:hypothetical protein
MRGLVERRKWASGKSDVGQHYESETQKANKVTLANVVGSQAATR